LVAVLGTVSDSALSNSPAVFDFPVPAIDLAADIR